MRSPKFIALLLTTSSPCEISITFTKKYFKSNEYNRSGKSTLRIFSPHLNKVRNTEEGKRKKGRGDEEILHFPRVFSRRSLPDTSWEVDSQQHTHECKEATHSTRLIPGLLPHHGQLQCSQRCPERGGPAVVD